MPRSPFPRQRHAHSVRDPRVLRRACAALCTLATLGLLLGAPLGVATAGTPTAASFSTFDLGAAVTPVGVNASGEVALNRVDAQSNPIAPALWSGGTTTPLATPSGTTYGTYLGGVSDQGVAVGTAFSSTAATGVVWQSPASYTTFQSPLPSMGQAPGRAYMDIVGVDAQGELAINVGNIQGDDIRQAWASSAYGTGLRALSPFGAPIGSPPQTSQTYGVNGGRALFAQEPNGLPGSSSPVYLGPEAGGSATLLDFQACSLASDGATVGVSGAAGVLRLPSGKETPLALIPACRNSYPAVSVNAAHDVIGTAPGQVPSLSSGAATIPIASLFPAGSGWSNLAPTGINDAGDIIGTGTLNGATHGFLLLKLGITVNDTGDTHDVTPGDGACTDSNGKCTLRAAIEEVNAQGSATPVDVSFNIPGGGTPTITPGSALPAVTAPVNLDASTQPGTGRERVLLGTKTGRLGFGGLDLQGTGSSVKGLSVSGFGGVGVKLEGAGGDQVTQSVLAVDDVGVEVDSPGVVLDGLGVAGNGSATGASSFEAATKGKNLTPAQAQGDLLALGGGIVVRSGAANLTIRGSVIGGLNPADGVSPGSLNESTGVLLAPGASAISGVTIGDPASPNFFRGNSFAVVAAAPGAPVSALTVAGNNFGIEPNGGPALAPLSNGIGVLLSGNVSAAQIGAPGARNTFVDSGVAIEALGAGIARLQVQFNLVGSDTALVDLLSPPAGQFTLGQHNLFGLILGDVSGATVGGALGAQNAFIGDATGILMSGKGSRLNTIQGNTFGRFAAPPGKVNARAIGQYGMIEAIVASEGGANQIGVAGLGNRFNDTLSAIHVAGEDHDIISANSVVDNLYGLTLNDVSQTSVGNASAASANTFQDNEVGTLQAHRELTGSEMTAAKLKPATADAAARAIPFVEPVAAGPLDLVGALSSAKVDATAATLADQGVAASVYSARYGRNYIGTAAGGTARHGNYIGMVFAGDVQRAIVGVGGGGPNLIEHNSAAGVAMFGVNGHAPQGVSLLGNAIYDNSNGPSPLFPGVKGLGIVLLNESAGSIVLGPTPNDPGDADSGPNGLQNYPLLTAVSQSRAAGLSYELALDSTANREFNVEVYSSPKCNPTGFGEGLHLLSARTVATGQSGSGVASVEPVLRLGVVVPGVKVPRGDHWLTATATAPDGSTSEFSPCVRIASAPQAVGVLPTVPGVSAAGITSVEVFNAGAYNVQEVQLDFAGSSHGAPDISASSARTTRPIHTLATTRLRIRPHHARGVSLHLSRAALKLLIKRHRLTVTAVVRATKGKRHLTVKIRYIIYAPRH
jgi:CSLREA domain-containing protein